MTIYWSNDEREIVLDMWQKGKTASVIAETLGQGRTRNSVLGYLFRLRKDHPELEKKTSRSTERKPAKAKTSKVKRPKMVKVVREPLPMVNAYTPIVEEDAPEGGIPYFETKRFLHCSYILNTSRDAHKIKCCGGKPFKNSSWCHKHYHEVFIERTSHGKQADHLPTGKAPVASVFLLRQM